MGYMGLSCTCDSDRAADLACNVGKAIAALLEKVLEDPGNGGNPSGAVNAALYIEETIKDASMSEELSRVIVRIIGLLDTHLKEALKVKPSQWEGKKMHVVAFKRLIRNLKKIPLLEI